MARPAGYSDDEDYSDYDDDYDGFEFAHHVRTPRPPPMLTPEEKLIDSIRDRNISAMNSVLDEFRIDVKKKIPKIDNWTPLMLAGSSAFREGVVELLKRGSDPNENHEMFNVIMCICGSPNENEEDLVATLNLVVEAGGDVTQHDWFKVTPLMLAVKFGRENLALTLIGCGCDVNATDNDGWSAIFYAVSSGKLEMVQLLLDSKAKTNVVDSRGRSLAEFSESQSKEMLELITGESVDEYDATSEQPLKIATSFSRTMAELPNPDDRFSGFPQDAKRFLSLLNLVLPPEFSQKPVSLGQLLTYGDKEWTEAGVKLSFHRRKIMTFVRRFHEKSWTPKSQVKIEDFKTLDMFSILQQILNVYRQLYTVSTTTYYVNRHPTSHNDPFVLNTLRARMLRDVNDIEDKVKIIADVIRKIDINDQIPIADRISPPPPKKFPLAKTVIVTSVVGIVAFKLYYTRQ